MEAIEEYEISLKLSKFFETLMTKCTPQTNINILAILFHMISYEDRKFEDIYPRVFEENNTDVNHFK